MQNKLTGATETSFKFLFQHLTIPKNVEIDFDPKRLIKSNKDLKIFWAHSNCDQPINQNIEWKKIDHVVCVSNWQKEQFIKYLNLPTQKITVIRNGGANYFVPKKEKSKTLIYTSTPFRGLKYLPSIFTKVLKKHPDAKLKVFSGMNLYGEENDDFEWLYDELRKIPNVEYSKAIEHEKLVEHYQESCIFCYPNIWEETSCVSLIEAMRCGCYPIITNIGALPETSCDFGSIVPIEGESHNDGWYVTENFCNLFSEEIIKVLDTYKYDDKISQFSTSHYDWKKISLEWKVLIDKLLQYKEIKMESLKKEYELINLPHEKREKLLNDKEILTKVYDDVFKWDEYDKELAQGRSNFQIEKFIALDNFTVSSTFSCILKNRRIMAEGLFSKIIEMKEKQREFDYRWKDKPKDQPFEANVNGERRLVWYDLDSLQLENYMRSCEMELRDRTQQLSFFDELLNRLLEMNGGPVTKEQFEREDHIYWERRFANQAYDEILSKATGISPGNLHSMRRSTAPTLVSNDINRVKNGFPDLSKLLSSSSEDNMQFIVELQNKILEGIADVTRNEIEKIDYNNNSQLKDESKSKTNYSDGPISFSNQSPKSLFNNNFNNDQ